MAKPDILCPVPQPSDQSKSDIKYSTEMNRWFLIPLGILPLTDKPTFIHKCISNMFALICASLLCFLLIPALLHMLLANINLKIKIKLIGPTNFTVMVISKYFFLLARKQKICKCLEHINIDWRRAKQSEDRKVMLAYARSGRFISTICASFMYGGGILYQTIAPLARGKILTANNISRYPLPYPVYAGLFVADRSPYYEIVFTFQWISSFLRYSINVATCSLGAVFVLHICGQLKIVISRLENFINTQDTKVEIKYKVAEIVELHLRSMSFITRIEEVLNEVCLIEVLGSTTIICLIGYYILMEFETDHLRTIDLSAYSVLLTSFTFNIFILCHIGEKLSQQRQEVGTIAYMIDWYKLSGKDARMLILLLRISNYPISLTAGKMAELSYRSFSSIIKTSMTFLNLLRTTIL